MTEHEHTWVEAPDGGTERCWECGAKKPTKVGRVPKEKPTGAPVTGL